MRVLVVDDEDIMRRVVCRLLKPHECVTACDGLEALSILERDSGFDAVVCDLQMPGLDGVGVHRELGRRFPHLESRFVLLTGDVSSAFGGTVLRKPASRGRLLQVVDRVARKPARSGTWPVDEEVAPRRVG